MATPSGNKNGGSGKKKESQPSKSAEKYFGSEVDLKLQGLINPPQKLTDDEKLPQPPGDLTDKKPSQDATQEESLKELAEKLQSLGKPKSKAGSSYPVFFNKTKEINILDPILIILGLKLDSFYGSLWVYWA